MIQNHLAARLYPWAPVRLLAQHEFNSFGKARTVDIPVLYFSGRPDPYMPRADARALFGQFRGPKLMVETGGGHHPVMDTFVHSGVIDFSSFERQVEFFRIEGDFAIIMGLETLVPNTDAPSAGLVAGQTLKRRFTNIWRKEPSAWRLFARHANVIPPR